METDTVKLLRECDAGVEMGVSSISDVLERVENPKMKEMLSSCKLSHEKLGLEISKSLSAYGDGGKSPNPIAKSMSWMKTNAELSLGIRESDRYGFKMSSFRRYCVKKPCNATALLRFFPCTDKNMAF